jgi:hypothetical protein
MLYTYGNKLYDPTVSKITLVIILHGILFVLDCIMFREDIDIKIRQLELDLEKETEKYMTSIKSHENYSTLRGIRDSMHEIKLELAALHSQLSQY